MAITPPPPFTHTTFPADVRLFVPRGFIHQALEFARFLPPDRLSPHDLVVALRFDVIDLVSGHARFRDVADVRELRLLDDIACGQGKHSVAPNWVI